MRREQGACTHGYDYLLRLSTAMLSASYYRPSIEGSWHVLAYQSRRRRGQRLIACRKLIQLLRLRG
jgi:hypothetical protein